MITGQIRGMTIAAQVVQPRTRSRRAASSTSGEMPCMPASRMRVTKGVPLPDVGDHHRDERGVRCSYATDRRLNPRASRKVVEHAGNRLEHKRQVRPIATGVDEHTGSRSECAAAHHRGPGCRGRRASRKPSASCTETVTRHQIVVSRMVFQKTSSPVSR